MYLIFHPLAQHVKLLTHYPELT